MTTDENIKDMSEFTKELEDKVGLGATGKFPKGKIKEEDEGELAFAITSHKGRVVMDFGKPVQWLAVEPEMAVEIANSLIKYAAEVKKEEKIIKP